MKVSAFTTLRLIVMLRRIWQSLEKANAIQMEMLKLKRDEMALIYPKWAQAGGRVPPKTGKLAEIATADVDDWNKNWRFTHPDLE